MCSVQDVSKDGRSNRSTSTFNVFCSNGTENVSAGILCSQLSSDRSESLKPEMELHILGEMKPKVRNERTS